MKSSLEQIATIFEVFLYDPLHNWCLSPKKAYMLQQASNCNSKEIASSSNTINNSDNSIITLNSSFLSGSNESFSKHEQNEANKKGMYII